MLLDLVRDFYVSYGFTQYITDVCKQRVEIFSTIVFILKQSDKFKHLSSKKPAAFFYILKVRFGLSP